MLNRENSDGSGYLRENQGNLQEPSDPSPNSLLLQGGRDFSSHPPSCHPRRVFGCPKSAKKMREKG